MGPKQKERIRELLEKYMKQGMAMGIALQAAVAEYKTEQAKGKGKHT